MKILLENAFLKALSTIQQFEQQNIYHVFFLLSVFKLEIKLASKEREEHQSVLFSPPTALVWWTLHHIRRGDPELEPQRHRPGKIFTDTQTLYNVHRHTNIIKHYTVYKHINI